MKKIKFLFISYCFWLTSSAQVKISDVPGLPDSRAILEAQSNKKGFFMPRVTTAERNAFTSSAPILGPDQKGLMVYDSTSKIMMIWDGTQWTNVASGGQYIQNQYSSAQPADMWITGTSRAGNWFRSSGASGWYNESYGGGLYMNDNTWVRIYGGKSFLHSTGTMETDGTFQVGPTASSRFRIDNTSASSFLPIYTGTGSPTPIKGQLNIDGFVNTQVPSYGGYTNADVGLFIANDNAAYARPSLAFQSNTVLSTGTNQNRQTVNTTITTNSSSGIALATGSLAYSATDGSGYRTTYGVFGSIRSDHPAGNKTIAGYFQNQLGGATDYAIWAEAPVGARAIWAAQGKAGGPADWINTSDARLKKDIVTIDHPLDKVLQLRGVYFQYRQEDFKDTRFPEGRRIGFIAQEVKKILPEVVTGGIRFKEKGNTEYLGLSYAEVTALLVEAVKEQNKLIVELKKDIEELRKRK